MQKNHEISEYKIILIGDGGCGKTSFVNCLRKGEFSGKYIATQGVDVSPVTLTTNYGTITFKIWDCAGQEKFGGLKDGYYIGANALIIMLDLTSKVSLRNMEHWVKDAGRVVGEDVPVIVCGNKIDALNRKITEEMIKEVLPKTVPYFNVSAKINYNVQTAVLELAKKLTGHSDLEFVDDLQ